MAASKEFIGGLFALVFIGIVLYIVLSHYQIVPTWIKLFLVIQNAMVSNMANSVLDAFGGD